MKVEEAEERAEKSGLKADIRELEALKIETQEAIKTASKDLQEVKDTLYQQEQIKLTISEIFASAPPVYLPAKSNGIHTSGAPLTTGRTKLGGVEGEIVELLLSGSNLAQVATALELSQDKVRAVLGKYRGMKFISEDNQFYIEPTKERE